PVSGPSATLACGLDPLPQHADPSARLSMGGRHVPALPRSVDCDRAPPTFVRVARSAAAQAGPRMTASGRRLPWAALADAFNVFAIHAAVYRLLGGRLVGRNMLILTTVGRKSGRVRSTPLFFVRDGADYVVVASNGGEDRHPGWWHNIRSDPNVTIQVG